MSPVLDRAGKLLLVEMVIAPENRPSPAPALDVNMLVLPGGRERGEDYQRLFQAPGFAAWYLGAHFSAALDTPSGAIIVGWEGPNGSAAL